ncbi:hypothetical protein HMPREF9062_1961 [Actinomyces sp. oral taxon 448 str. F0400]|nr:hypothetical protein HMPREF9062_1961 [Actinomyces sp. oral taxon 448 str. F0400]
MAGDRVREPRTDAVSSHTNEPQRWHCSVIGGDGPASDVAPVVLI